MAAYGRKSHQPAPTTPNPIHPQPPPTNPNDPNQSQRPQPPPTNPNDPNHPQPPPTQPQPRRALSLLRGRLRLPGIAHLVLEEADAPRARPGRRWQVGHVINGFSKLGCSLFFGRRFFVCVFWVLLFFPHLFRKVKI